MGRADGYIYRAVELTHAASDFYSHRPKNDRFVRKLHFTAIAFYAF